MSSRSSGRSAARPTSSKSGSPSMIREIPSRSSALSSASTTRIVAMPMRTVARRCPCLGRSVVVASPGRVGLAPLGTVAPVGHTGRVKGRLRDAGRDVRSVTDGRPRGRSLPPEGHLRPPLGWLRLPGRPGRPHRRPRPRQPGGGPAHAVLLLHLPGLHEPVGPHRSVYGALGGGWSNPDYDPALAAAIARLPHVRHVAAGFEVDGRPADTRRVAEAAASPARPSRGERQRAVLPPGPRRRHPGPHVVARARPDEIVMAPIGRRSSSGFHVGQVIPYGFYSDAQQNLPGFGTSAVPAGAARQPEAGRPGRVELGDRGGRRRHPPHVRPSHARAHPGDARDEGSTVRRRPRSSGSRPNGGAATVPAVEREVARSHPARGHLHVPRAGPGRRQGRPLAEADLHRARGLRRASPSLRRS